MKKLTEVEIRAWKMKTWVLFSQYPPQKKKFFVGVGERLYRVTHGDVVVFEGWRIKMAVRTYNKIRKPPAEEEGESIVK